MLFFVPCSFCAVPIPWTLDLVFCFFLTIKGHFVLNFLTHFSLPLTTHHDSESELPGVYFRKAQSSEYAEPECGVNPDFSVSQSEVT